MADVILYAALRENQNLIQELLDICSCRASSTGISINYYTTPQSAGYPYVGGGLATAQCPQIVLDWKTYLTPYVNTTCPGFKVCDGSGYYRCGSNCSWTVPGGVTRVQFQIWGPGSSTGSNCCCGGAPFGASGAYSVVQMNVSAGEIYCLCAGCAYCCYASQTTPGLCGSPSWVCGPGLYFCADSGISCFDQWAQDIRAPVYGSSSTGCGLPAFDGCSADSCSGWNFCWNTGADDTCILHAYSRQTWTFICAGTGRCLCCWGLNGIWPSIYIPTGGMTGAYTVAPPVFGFENCACCETGTGTTCSGCNRAPGIGSGLMCIPGAGGYGGFVYGGCNACGGDSGRMGMVCVTCIG